MIISIAGQWESKGNPPPAIKKLPKWLWRMFYWNKKGEFHQSGVFEDRILLELPTPVGLIAAAIDQGRLVVLLNSAISLVDIDLLPDHPIPFSWSVSGQSVRGSVSVTN